MSETQRILRRVAAVLAAIIVAAGVVVLVGWQYHLPWLRGQLWGGGFIAPNSAACFIASGASVLLQLQRRRFLPQIGTVLAILVTAFALLTCAEYLSESDFGMDTVVMGQRLSDWDLPLPGRFPLSSAIGFTLAGISLLSLRWRESKLFTEFFACLVFLGSYLSVIGYLYRASVLYDHIMAWHTVVLFALLGIALLCAAPRRTLLGIVLSPFAGAFAARTMIWAIAVLLPVFRLAELWAETQGYVSVRYGSALSVVAAVAVFTALALRTGAVLNATDKRQRDTEAALIKSEKIAAAGRMAAAVAHEINNPMEAVGNILYLLKSSSLPPDARDQYLNLAEVQLQRVAAIARRTLGFYKDETNAVEIDLPELIDGVLNIYQGKLGPNVSVRRLYSAGARIFAKEGEIQQVIANLISNANDALADQGGQIEIVVKATDQRVTIVVRDDGSGIASEDLDHIFEPFFSKKKKVGTGLGLWVSKDLVKRNGGTIEVVSSTGGTDHGTTFRLQFPAVQAKEAPLRRSAAESA